MKFINHKVSMRTIFHSLAIYLLVFVATLMIEGCDQPLNETPKTFLSKSGVFNTKKGAIAATVGIYKPLDDNDLYGWWLLGCNVLFADYTKGRGSQAPLAEYKLGSTSIQRIGYIWTGAYRLINRANIVIQQLKKKNIDSISPNLRNQLIGEARFLRALSYFHLVRLFGNVPLRLKPVKGADYSISRSPKDKVYTQIIKDLEFGEENLPESYPPAKVGRATHWAATSLLSLVYLTQKKWNKAAAKAKEIMDSGQFSLVKVDKPEDFQKIFGPTETTNSEVIFSLKHARVQGLGFPPLWLMHKPGSGYSLGSNAYAWFGDLNSWLGDWVDSQLKNNGPDLRAKDFLYNGPHDEKFLSPEIPMLFKKFRDTESQYPGNDFPILRYAEVLFIYAEAESQANGRPTAGAYEAVNKVRRRAYGKDISEPSAEADYPPGLSAEAFRDTLLLERAKEFVMEGKRWYDLLRTGRALKVIQALGKPIQEKHLKWPIPDEEIDNNDSLNQADQNPGW